MNYIQFGLFILYFISILVAGIIVYAYIINKNSYNILNRSVYIAEALLLGSILIIGEMLALSLIGLYRAPYLWSAVFLNYLFLLKKSVRNAISYILLKRIKFDLPILLFIILIGIFIFRNCYFLVDVDSHSTYLFTQRLWLSKGTSIIGDPTYTFIIFLPQFDVVPYSLGLSIFGQETLFPALISLFWRLLVILLLFGYTSYRFNRYYGLAAVMFFIFNDHIFYSGVNHWVLINSAVAALMFAVAYNFWESRKEASSPRFLLSIIFLTQLLSNKYQMAYASVILLIFGILIQISPIEKIKEIFTNKRWLLIILISIFIMALWFIKNFVITGDPVFPGFAGRFHVFNWTIDQENTFLKFFGGVKPLKFIKYMNYLFIWPGINAGKLVIITISLFPLILLFSIKNRDDLKKELLYELCFWLGISILVIMGVCLSCHQEPRYYRYSIGILSFTAILAINYILKYCFDIRNNAFVTIVILLVSSFGYKIIYSTEGPFLRPTFKENIDVLFNRIHTQQAIKKHYPQIEGIYNVLNDNKDKLSASAWDMESFNINIPQFLLPVRPVVSLWYSTVIKWDSYKEEGLIIKDLKDNGIKWIMQMDETLKFLPIEVYAKQAVKYNRHPENTFFGYVTPPELNKVDYN